MHLARTRSLFFLAFIACALVIGGVVYLQRVFGLVPCVLCHWQRGALIACAAVCLAAGLHGPRDRGCRVYGGVLMVIALLGAGIAGGQVWLQTATVDELGPVLVWFEQLLDWLSQHSAVDRLRSDATLCAAITWSLFGISLPEWSLLAFVGLALLAAYPLLRGWGRSGSAESRVGD
jgi:disulfide bond formation protein DsbB